MTIPASDIVVVNPGVVSAGGSPLALNGVILSQNEIIPSGYVLPIVSADSARAYFGPTSDEYKLAQIYFLGFDNSTIKPGTLYFAPYADADRAAWLRSGSLAGTTLTELQAMTGTLIITIDGTESTSGEINLSAATSFSNAADMIVAGFTGTAPECTWDAVSSTFTLKSPTTGLDSSMTFASGTLADSLKLSSQQGAILSDGAVADTPDSAMTNVKLSTQNWVDFMTIWEPDVDVKEEFAVWTNAQNQRYVYVCWDTDEQATVPNSKTCFGYLADQAAYDAVMCVYNTPELAAFVLGTVASIDFSRTNGRITGAFKSQSGFTATVTDQQTSSDLLANGYNFYGSYATANDQFNFLYSSQISGKWKWLDTFVNQVYLNSQLQLALINLLVGIKSIPYNEAGYALIRAAMIDPIMSSINFGGIRKGVTLSNSQKAQVNQAAGKDVTADIESQGYYLQILDPGAQVRGQRGTPVINLWYTDGGAIQKITVASIDIM